MRLFLDCVANAEIVNALIAAGANVNAFTTDMRSPGKTPLHVAALSHASARLPPAQRNAARAPMQRRSARGAAG